MIKFEKVSFEQYADAILNISPIYKDRDYDNGPFFKEKLIHSLKEQYDRIKLPKRATSGSAGYDFYMPLTGGLLVEKGKKYLIPTGIRAFMPSDVILSIYPRSGMGTKHGMHLTNTTGIIDSDYVNADNEGHIMISIIADNDFIIEPGQAFAQGVFQHYLITDDDNVSADRTGGFGSTDKG